MSGRISLRAERTNAYSDHTLLMDGLPEAAPIKCAGRESAGLPTLSVGEFVSLPALSIWESVGLPTDSLPSHFIGAASDSAETAAAVTAIGFFVLYSQSGHTVF